MLLRNSFNPAEKNLNLSPTRVKNIEINPILFNESEPYFKKFRYPLNNLFFAIYNLIF